MIPSRITYAVRSFPAQFLLMFTTNRFGSRALSIISRRSRVTGLSEGRHPGSHTIRRCLCLQFSPSRSFPRASHPIHARHPLQNCARCPLCFPITANRVDRCPRCVPAHCSEYHTGCVGVIKNRAFPLHVPTPPVDGFCVRARHTLAFLCFRLVTGSDSPGDDLFGRYQRIVAKFSSCG